MSQCRAELHAAALAVTLSATFAHADPASDAAVVAALDTQYQSAVERNDVDTMARILHPDSVLVTGRGKSFSRQDLLDNSAPGWTYTSIKSRFRAPDRAYVRQGHGNRHCVALDQGIARRRQAAGRVQALVQRHLRAHR